MKMLFRSYLASLRERGELDAILPDLLSELGYLVFSRPGRGTSQAGVDIAALGPETDGKRKFYLFTIKRGDISRESWHDPTPQGLRASLHSIIDNYIPNRIPHRFRSLDVVVCIVFGGDMQEQVRSDVEGFVRQNSAETLTFEEWNGDVLASLLMSGVLREDLMPKPIRTHFQKAVAMVDEPDIAHHHFCRLVQELVSSGSSEKDKVRAARQMYIALWVLYVWARDIDNVEAAYRSSELVLLRLWNGFRPFIDKRGRTTRDLSAVLTQATRLHVLIAHEFLHRKVLPHVKVLHGLSTAVRGEAPADVNLKLFDVLGRIALTGLWFSFFEQRADTLASKKAARLQMQELAQAGLLLIQHNPALLVPLQDIHSVEVSLFLCLVVSANVGLPDARHWLQEMAKGIFFAVRTHGRYPCVFGDYRDLIAHPREASAEYQQEAMSGSTLLPLIAAFLAAFGDHEDVELLAQLQREHLQKCTLQVWLPDEASEEAMYVGSDDHGMAILDLQLSNRGLDLFAALDDALREAPGFSHLSAIKAGFWPIILMACRHHRLPVPPQFWRPMLQTPTP